MSLTRAPAPSPPAEPDDRGRRPRGTRGSARRRGHPPTTLAASGRGGGRVGPGHRGGDRGGRLRRPHRPQRGPPGRRGPGHRLQLLQLQGPSAGRGALAADAGAGPGRRPARPSGAPAGGRHRAGHGAVHHREPGPGRRLHRGPARPQPRCEASPRPDRGGHPSSTGRCGGPGSRPHGGAGAGDLVLRGTAGRRHGPHGLTGHPRVRGRRRRPAARPRPGPDAGGSRR